MPAGDIDAVEREIRAVRRAVLEDWREAAGAGIDAVIAELDRDPGPEDSRAARNAAIAAALLLLARALEAPPSDRVRRRARASARRLIEAGARSSGISGAAAVLGSTEAEETANRVGDSLVTSSRLRAGSRRMSGQIRSGARELEQVAREERDLESLRRSAAADEARQAESAAAEERRRQARRELEERARDLARRARRARRDLKKAISDTNGALSTNIADVWAYRAFNLGVLLAAEEAGIERLIAINPNDDRTTPFCRWVHRKVIRVSKARRKIDAFLGAAEAQDRGKMIRAWPFLKQSKGALERLRARNGGSQILGFRRHFANVGLPPYHWKCRTRAVPEFVALRLAA